MKLTTIAVAASALLIHACSTPKPDAPLVTPVLAQGAVASDAPAVDSFPTQITWQRSLDDALAIQAAEKRPLLVAINVDGESASDRIVVERYRDPAFVAQTRRFVCVIGHPLRHTARDFDDDGRRIVCPRLGEVTCGEHVAMEPLVFERFLQGNRIAPRHALVQQGGTKSFDLFELFDLRDLDTALANAAQAAPPPALEPRWNELELATLATRRENRARSVLESLASELTSQKQRLDALTAIAEHGDAGSVGALRCILARDRSQEVVAGLEHAARALEVAPALADAARQRLFALPDPLGGLGFGADVALVGALARLDGASQTTRSMLLAALAIAPANERDATRKAVETAFGAEETARIDAAIAKEGGAFDLGALLMFARDVPTRFGSVEPRAKTPVPSRDDAERELIAADEALAKSGDDREAMVRFGRATLAAARARLESGDRTGLDALFQDAQHWLARASAGSAPRPDVQVDRMRAAYYLSRFDEQEALARELLPGWPDALGNERSSSDAKRAPDERRAEACARDSETLEALRWLGDACAKRHLERMGQDPAEAAGAIVRGARALAIVAASPEASEDDWNAFASYFSLLEMARSEYAATRAAVLRLPDSNALRNALNQALHLAGRIDRAGVESEVVLARHPGSAASAWYSGYAWLLAAEDARRAENAKVALERYGIARDRFDASLDLEQSYADTVKRHAALCELGSGFAHLLAGDRASGAKSLVEALKIDPMVGDVRDGLDREALDLVDGTLEWTALGPSPVDALALAQDLRSISSDDPRWISAVADSQLREALRADGRSPHTVKREIERRGEGGTVRKVVLDLRVPTDEGDDYMERSIAIARLAREVRDDGATQRSLAQSLTSHAERWLERGETARAVPLLTEAADLLMAEAHVAVGSDVAAIEAFARRLRAKLGPARPVARPGR